MNSATQRVTIPGPAGALECAVDLPARQPPRGTAIVCHPNPQQGGTMDNKVAQTLARAVVAVGWRSVRFNYRGVGGSQGVWDDGVGEIDDALAVVEAFPDTSLMMAGFSFGAYIASHAAQRLPEGGKPQRLVLVGPSVQRQAMAPVPADTFVIHGEVDDVVPLQATLDWARSQSLPVTVFPGVGHFFHGQLSALKNVLVQELTPRVSL